MISNLGDLIARQSETERRADRTETLQTPPFRNGARVYRNSAQAINNNALTAISFAAARFNYSSDGTLMWVIGSPTRLTCVVPGVYDIKGHIAWEANATGVRALLIRLGGATFIASSAWMAVTSAAAGTDMSIATTYELAATNYVELIVYQLSGGPLNVNTLGNYSAEFSAWKVV